MPAKTLRQSKNVESDDFICSWIQSQYLNHAFSNVGFIGWKKFVASLVQQRPQDDEITKSTVNLMREDGHIWKLEHPDWVMHSLAAKRNQEKKEQTKQEMKRESATVGQTPHAGQIDETRYQAQTSSSSSHDIPPLSGTNPTLAFLNSKLLAVPTIIKESRPSNNHIPMHNDVHLAKRLRKFQISKASLVPGVTDFGSDASDDESAYNLEKNDKGPNFSLINRLNVHKGKSIRNTTIGPMRDIDHAPLLSGSVLAQYVKDLVPQYGLIGCNANEEPKSLGASMFQNTNVPYSAFICGVQGSGKSYTTACMLENSLIPSKQLGRLRAPVSALVFSYGEFSNSGKSFSISEAAHLASSSKEFPTERVKRITVLRSPSNPAIQKFYQHIPGVKIIPFKLKAKSLDIGTLLTLMAVNEKSETPLYMARVESILRAIATESEDGVFDYSLFKQKLDLETFNPAQTNMLQMRLGLLESFLDRDDCLPEPRFRPGELTIVDLSDPFVNATTACILFKLCLERFMQSSSPAKMVVLDEAHKYMLRNPGSKALTDYVATLIRLQRHKGVRVIISTQEPTVSTDLIALCSVTFIHRFTSPVWYAALRKHINAMDNDKEIMQQIEGLKTGEALVYAPNAVLGMNDDEKIIKATGRLLRLNIRKRVTFDGGDSIMAV